MKYVIIVKWLATDEIEVFPTLTSFLDKHPIAPIDTINNYISRKKQVFECEQCLVTKIEINRKNKKNE